MNFNRWLSAEQEVEDEDEDEDDDEEEDEDEEAKQSFLRSACGRPTKLIESQPGVTIWLKS